MHFSQFPIALCLAATMSLSGASIFAADKKHDKDNRTVARRVASPMAQTPVSHGNGRSVAVQRPSGGSNRQQFITNARGHDIQQLSSRNLTSVSPRHADRVVSQGRRAVSSPTADTRIATSQLAAQSTRNTRVLRASPADQIDRRTTTLSSSSPSVRSSDVTRYDRDRTNYSQRHEHHSSDWYRSNGWSYDSEYWRTHHHHRYFNDALGVFIFDNFGPDYVPYGYGYDPGYSYAYSEPMYMSSYAVDAETAMAVQDALAQQGYYNGPIDGIIGPGTRAAISKYQADAGLAVTGMIDDSLIRSLRID